jgi:hypothetical protein
MPCNIHNEGECLRNDPVLSLYTEESSIHAIKVRRTSKERGRSSLSADIEERRHQLRKHIFYVEFNSYQICG